MKKQELKQNNDMDLFDMYQIVKGEELNFYMTEKEKAAEVIIEYLNVCREHGIDHHLESKYIDEMINSLTRYGIKLYSIEVLLYQYLRLKKENNEELLEAIMKEHNFNYAPSIRNAFYYLLSNPSDLIDFSTNPMLWPGMKNVVNHGNSYIIETELGRIEVSKATPKFLRTNSSYIFKKPLIHKCFARTYDFVKENKDSYAILSKQPNFFFGYDYHAYVERNGEIIDIAANAYYDKKEFASTILVGEEMARLSFEEITEELSSLDTSCLEGKEKLYMLSTYHDIKNRNIRH